jgi:hypothetical protein
VNEKETLVDIQSQCYILLAEVGNAKTVEELREIHKQIEVQKNRMAALIDEMSSQEEITQIAQ